MLLNGISGEKIAAVRMLSMDVMMMYRRIILSSQQDRP